MHRRIKGNYTLNGRKRHKKAVDRPFNFIYNKTNGRFDVEKRKIRPIRGSIWLEEKKKEKN